MSKTPTYKLNSNNMIVTIPISTDDYLEKFILDNAYMYNKIRNDFVEESNKYKGEYNMYYGFNPRQFHTEYFNTVEKPDNRYEYYCVGLSEQVSENFDKSVKTIRTKNSKVLNGEVHADLGGYKFKKFDKYRYTFRVKLKPTIYKKKVRTKLKINSKRDISFRVRSNKYGRTKEVIDIKLNEDLYNDIIHDFDPIYIRTYSSNGITNDCMFKLSDIKDIGFKFECGRYYIQLFIDATYLIDKRSLKTSKNRIAGIDTGIHHPITIYDGGDKPIYLSMDDKTTRKIHYLERRARRLQSIADKKREYNKAHDLSVESKNIEKLNRKIRKIYLKIKNIKINWTRNTAKQITTSYEIIVVDRFEVPNHKDDDSLPKSVLRKINYANRFHKTYYFNEFLYHDSIKYGCKYIESPEDTTRTCSICGYVNEHLELNQRFLVCENCKSKIERDENAAKNCYKYGLSL